MASQFDRWEKDPFFSAAEEVQESADRMLSTYRTWVHSMKDSSGLWNSDELSRDLRTALGTAKWQLEEFARAVNSSYVNNAADDAKDRHREFITAIGSQISEVETSLTESTVSQGKPPLPWVRLDEGERDELAMFLAAPTFSNTDKVSWRLHGREQQSGNSQQADKQSEPTCSQNSPKSTECCQLEAKEEKLPGHRRTASASADIASWKIAVADDPFPQTSSNIQVDPPPRKIPSFSGFLNTMESASKLKWSKNAYRKLKPTDRQSEVDTALPQSQPLTRGLNSCYERSKSCLEGCDECYDKQLYGWYGSIQRQLQRSQYHMQYNRPVKLFLSAILLLCVIVLLAYHAI